MLRVLTIILLVIGITFVAWSLLVMTGGRDWLAATMTADTTVADAAPPKVETPTTEAPAMPEEAKPVAEESEAAEAGKEESPTGQEPADKPAEDESAGTDEPADEAGKDESAGGEEAAASADAGGNPLETAKSAEKGSLKSPYADDYASVAEEGHKKYMSAGCNGCHGGTGGGGMGPPLTNPVWVYGNDGDTLFRLIALGTVDLQKQGYTRKGSENVVGPMPPMGGIVKSNDDLWKIIAWIWSVNPPKAASAAPPQ